MKINMMKNRARTAILTVALSTAAIGWSVSASPQIRTQFFILTAAGSPSNNACLQNAMSYMDKGWTIGYIPTDFTSDPAALNMPHVLRACQIISGPTSLALWDGTNAPTGNFTNQCGSRIGWGLDWKDTNQFLVSEIYFRLWSSEPANSLLYSGNLATNTANGLPLAFSSFLRGELLDANGNIVADYHNGESIADHPVNRVMALIREGYYAPDMATVALDLSYFKDEMNFVNFASFTTVNGSGTTNQISSRLFINPPARSASDGKWYVPIEGQRQLGFTYYLLQTTSLNHPRIWLTIAGGHEGLLGAGAYSPDSYFQGMESNGVSQAFAPALVGKKAQAPTVSVSNGDE